MIIKPLFKKVLVAEIKAVTKSEAGIILDNANSVREQNRAKVLAIGPDVTDVKEGDTILLDWTKASVVKIEGAQRAIVDQDHIVAVLEG
jgi:co-chaperonin GroES (HSP10)